MHEINDRRHEAREGVASKVRVAYARGGGLPADECLEEVECHNLSRSGFAYWTVAAPEDKELLVVFGEPPHEIRVKARVVHYEVAQHDRRLRNLIGCRFIERL